MQITRIFDLLPYILENYNRAKAVVLAQKKASKWLSYSIHEYIDLANKVSFGLLTLGAKKGDKIITITQGRPEWNFVDMGVLQIGAVHISLSPTLNNDDLTYILQETEAKIVFVANKFLYNKIKKLITTNHPVIRQGEQTTNIYTFDTVKGAQNFNELLALGKKHTNFEKLEQLKNEVSPEDVAVIIYSSDPTPPPKGIMLTHKNIVSNFISVTPYLKFEPSFKALSYLPLSSAYERTNLYVYQYSGMSIYYASSVATLINNLKETKPDVITTVPIFLHRIYEYLLSESSKFKGIRKKIFLWALNLGLRYKPNNENGWWYELKLMMANIFIFRRWRKLFGGNIKRVICGGAKLKDEIIRVFYSAKIPILEGYGLTEASPLISVNPFDAVKFGTVGKILNGITVKIADDGEILCKGPNVMKGYYKKSELTKKVIDNDGWLHTGDFGTIDKDGYITLTGVKKEIFKTSTGLYVSPKIIVNKLKQSPFISDATIIGTNQDFLTAIITPDFAYLQKWCNENNLEYPTKSEILINIFQKEIDRYNKTCRDVERIEKFELVGY